MSVGQASMQGIMLTARTPRLSKAHKQSNPAPLLHMPVTTALSQRSPTCPFCFLPPLPPCSLPLPPTAAPFPEGPASSALRCIDEEHTRVA